MALAVLATAMLVAALAAVASGVWLLRRRNRVHPRRASGAPIAWLASPVPAARAHRQLRGAVRLTLADGGLPPSLSTPAGDLHQQAVRLDGELVRAARLPRTERRRRVHALRAEVLVVERTAVRLVGLARQPLVASGADGDALADLVERVELIASARDELAAPPTGLAARGRRDEADAPRAPSATG